MTVREKVVKLAGKIRTLILSFDDSEFYQVIRGRGLLGLVLKKEFRRIYDTHETVFYLALRTELDSYGICTTTGNGSGVMLFISTPLFYLIKSDDDLGLPVEPCRDASIANMWYTTGEVVLSVFKEAYTLLRRAQRVNEGGPPFFGRWVPSVMVKKWVAIRDKVDVQPSTIPKLDYQKANAYGRRIRTRKRSL